MAEPVDWPALMRAGLGRLLLAPETFWSMTPGEFRAALDGAGLAGSAGAPMDRAAFEALRAAYPDTGPAPANDKDKR